MNKRSQYKCDLVNGRYMMAAFLSGNSPYLKRWRLPFSARSHLLLSARPMTHAAVHKSAS